MRLRARFVRWLAIKLGVMTPQKEERMPQQMQWSQDQIAAIIGTKELEIISLRMQVAALTERLKQYEPADKPNLEAVK